MATGDEHLIYVLQLSHLASGEKSIVDGHYVVDYDASRPGVGSSATSECHLVTTLDWRKAKRFASEKEAVDCWQQVNARDPVRPDGKPNRPLTSYTIEVQEIQLQEIEQVVLKEAQDGDGQHRVREWK